MAQATDYPVQTAADAPVTPEALVARLNLILDALLTNNAGPTRPTYAQVIGAPLYDTDTGLLSIWDGSAERFVPLLVDAPASASATGTAGQWATDADYLYICTATDTWKRVAIATW